MDHAFGVDWSVVSLPVILGTAVVMIALERWVPYDRGQKFFRVGFFTDFFWYTLVQSYLLGLAISWIVRRMDQGTGWSRLHLVSSWPVLAQLAFFWVTHDFYIYWYHRLQHANPYLWRTHEAHHSVHNVDFIAGARSHPVEILVNQTIEYAPIVLLGAHPEMALLKGVLDATWGMWIHANIGVRTGFLQYVLNGPEMHRWHHSIDYPGNGFNYGTKLAIWDWLFGTAYLPYLRETSVADRATLGDTPRGYGLSEAYPEETTKVSLVTTYFEQLAYMLRSTEPAQDAARAPEHTSSSAMAE